MSGKKSKATVEETTEDKENRPKTTVEATPEDKDNRPIRLTGIKDSAWEKIAEATVTKSVVLDEHTWNTHNVDPTTVLGASKTKEVEGRIPREEEQNYMVRYLVCNVEKKGHAVMQIMYFKDEPESQVWHDEKNKIEKQARDVCLSGRCPLGLWSEWLESCRKFRIRWGDKRVPLHLRFQINDCRKRHFGMKPNAFGPYDEEDWSHIWSK